MNIKGKLKVKSNEQIISDKFKKREFVITIDEKTKYPQDILLVLTQAKTNIIDQFNLGDIINCHINFKGREYNGKYFTTIECWQITNDEEKNPLSTKYLNALDSHFPNNNFNPFD